MSQSPQPRDWTECDGCGALVANTYTHDRFHSVLASHAHALAVLKTAHLAAHVHDRYEVVERINAKRFDNWSSDALAEVMAEMDKTVRETP